jgi:glutamine amidotransferase
MSAVAAGHTLQTADARSQASAARRMAVAVADYGGGNLRSVTSALVRAGADPRITADAAVVTDAPLAVVAGVGHVASAVRGLTERGLGDALRARLAAGRPTLGICVGMQLLFGASEEGGVGLGLLEGEVRRVRAPRVPHMGWNSLDVVTDARLLDGLRGRDVYFAHSYAVHPDDPSVVAATTDHAGPLVAAVAAGPLAGVQFHPERSGPAGARLLANVVAWSRSA